MTPGDITTDKMKIETKEQRQKRLQSYIDFNDKVLFVGGCIAFGYLIFMIIYLLIESTP